MSGLASHQTSLRKVRSEELRPVSRTARSISPQREIYSAWLEKLPASSGIDIPAAQTLLDHWLAGKNINDIPVPTSSQPINGQLKSSEEAKVQKPPTMGLERRWTLPVNVDDAEALIDLRGVGAFAPELTNSQIESALTLSFSQPDESVAEMAPQRETDEDNTASGGPHDS